MANMESSGFFGFGKNGIGIFHCLVVVVGG